jgi:hypothetical protein
MNPPETAPERPAKLALSRHEAAEALGVSAVTIDRLTLRGLLRPSRATRRPLYAVWEIERFLRETTGDLVADIAPRRASRAARAAHGHRTNAEQLASNLSSPSRSQEGGNEPSCRASSAEIDKVRPIPPREAGGLSLAQSLEVRSASGSDLVDGGAS